MGFLLESKLRGRFLEPRWKVDCGDQHDSSGWVSGRPELIAGGNATMTGGDSKTGARRTVGVATNGVLNTGVLTGGGRKTGARRAVGVISLGVDAGT